jgi:hypothetical protein
VKMFNRLPITSQLNEKFAMFGGKLALGLNLFSLGPP